MLSQAVRSHLLFALYLNSPIHVAQKLLRQREIWVQTFRQPVITFY